MEVFFHKQNFTIDDMFLFTWDNEARISGINAYDSQGNILFEDDSWR